MSLEFDAVGHRYPTSRGDQVLRDVSLSVPQAQITCLLGPSGSGKTTLLRLAAGLERLQRGRILLDGEVLAGPGVDPPPEGRPVGLVFQEHVLFPHMTVRENVAFGLHGLAPDRRRAKAMRQLEEVGLAAFADRHPHTLSGGQQQRVALARALAPLPRALLLDEPFASVEVPLRRLLCEDARRALKASGGIALVVTHDPELALEIADRVAVLEDGRIVQAGSASAIWQAPATRTVAELFGQTQRLRGWSEGDAVRTRFGPLPAATRTDCRGELDVLVRAGAVTLAPAGASDASPAAQIADIRFLGDGYLVLAEAQDETLRAHMKELDGLGVGDGVVAKFHGEGVFVYSRK